MSIPFVSGSFDVSVGKTFNNLACSAKLESCTDRINHTAMSEVNTIGNSVPDTTKKKTRLYQHYEDVL